MVTLSWDMLVGIGIGLVIAIFLFAGQNTLGDVSRRSPLGCLFGLIFISIAVVLMLVNGWIRFA
jgi:hypothetical protein